MKKKILAFVCFILIGGFSTTFFNACDKDTNCYVEVTVVDEVSKLPVSNVFIKIDVNSSYFNAEGYTDPNGKFYAEFAFPAIYNVEATYETGYDSTIYTPDKFFCYRKGKNTIRLSEGDTVKTIVNLEKDTIREFRTK